MKEELRAQQYLLAELARKRQQRLQQLALSLSRYPAEREQAEAEARRQKEYLETFFDSWPDVVFIIKKDGVLAYTSKTLENVLGYEIDDVKGRPFSDFTPPRLQAFVQRKWAEIATGAGGGYRMKVLKANTDVADCIVSLTLLAGTNEYLGVLRDVTDSRRSGEDRRRVTRRVVEVQEGHRSFIAKEFHDRIGQFLSGLKLSLETFRRQPSEPAATKLDEAVGIPDELMGRVRSLSLELRLAMLDDMGLVPTLLRYFDRFGYQTGVQVHFSYNTGMDATMPGAVTTASYRIIQEALTNVARHAGVREAWVTACTSGSEVRLEIEDQGRGFDPQKKMAERPCAGLTAMRERVTALGGSFEITCPPGRGTLVRAVLPLAGVRPVSV